jgi:hypothetical protein
VIFVGASLRLVYVVGPAIVPLASALGNAKETQAAQKPNSPHEDP